MTSKMCGVSLIAACGLASSVFAQFTGPSTTQSPYVLPSASGVTTTSILTVGDTIGGYRMVGIPDGMGALGNTDGSFDLFLNHELGSSAGIARAHGSRGSFISRWNISSNLTVNSGRDHNMSANDVNTWNGTGYVQGTTVFNRFCSGDLADSSAYRFGNLGTSARIFMNGEESGPEGRAFAHVVTGAGMNSSWQLPALGRFSWENSIASPYAQRKTVVVGTDDTSVDGQVYVYVGTKTDTGNDVQRAGLTNGGLYGIKVVGAPQQESRTTSFAAGSRFEMVAKPNVTNMTGAALNADSVSRGVTNFLRPEDGCFDPRPGFKNDFYFVTTDRVDAGATVGRSRLYRMRFDDITNPEAGGQLDELLSTTRGPQMMDNMCIDSHGRLILQEDVGGNAMLGKIWMYNTHTDQLTQIAQHTATLFAPGAAGFLTNDEESSGVFDAKDILGDNWFMINTQAHYGLGGELVEGGQLMAMYVPMTVPSPAAPVLMGVGILVASRRRRG
jgi:hypothetical protein